TQVITVDYTTAKLAPDQFTSFPGQSIAHYKILSPLGKGGMGEVYLAEDQKLGRKAAIKFLPAALTYDEDRVRRFIQEAKAASALNHPNIVTIYELGEVEAGRFIAMEYISGQTLRALSRQSFSLPMLEGIASQIAKALGVAHDAGIIHRDIKPENIMVRADGYVKVLDFGLARLAPDNVIYSPSASPNATNPGMILGTLGYLAPEQARGEVVTSSTDLFALGIVLYELATGRHPFQSDTPLGFLHAITSQTPLPPSTLNPQIPAGLEAMILRMLEKDPRIRISLAELDAALTRKTDQGVEIHIAQPSVKRNSVGREKERAEILSAFNGAAGGRSLLLCVAGEPGMGKTTLVDDCLAEIAGGARPCSIARGRCSERLAGNEAYLPILEALENLLYERTGTLARAMRLLAPTWYAQIASLSPDNSSDARVLSDIKSASQERLKRELSNFLEEASKLQPVAIFLDDLHWADESTTDMLVYLSGKFADLRVLIIGTYRLSELLLNKHPLSQARLELQGRGLCEEIELEFLTREDVDRYLALEFPGHRFPAELAKLIHAKTEGNPLFMADLARYLRDQQVILREPGEEQGQWLLKRDVTTIQNELPQSVRSLIRKKIDRLSETDRRLLVGASVQGYEFDSAVVSKALGMDPAEVEERLEDLDRVHAFVELIAEQELPDRTLTLRYRFVHALYQNALYATLKPTRRATLGASVAEALLGYHGEHASSLALDLALLYETARDFASASDFFLAAARQATQLFAYQEAVGLSRRGLENLKALPDSSDRARKELALQATLAGPLTMVKGFTAKEVGQTYARAQELFEQLGEPAEVFPVLFGPWAFYYSTAQTGKAREVAEQTLRLAEREQQPMMLLLAYHMIGTTVKHCGDFPAARDYLDRAMQVYAPEHDRAIVLIAQVSSAMNVCSWSSFALYCMGYPDQALKRIEQALAIAQDLAHPPSIAAARVYSALHFQLRRDPHNARAQAEAGIALSNEHGILHFLTTARQAHGWALAAMGETEAGVASMRESIETQRAYGTEMGLAYFLATLAEIHLREDQIQEGLTAVSDGLETVNRTGDTYHEPELYRLKGDLLLKSNVEITQSEAEDCFRQAIAIAQRQSAK
ncbi:MAG: serine/threonine-protein kinase PknK, partial [Blastocatellia bacterium]